MAIARITDIRGLVTLDGTNEEILKNRDEISDHGGILTIHEFAKIIFEDGREVEVTGPVTFNLDSTFFNEGTFEESITQISDLASLDYISNQLDEVEFNDDLAEQNSNVVNLETEQLRFTLTNNNLELDSQAAPSSGAEEVTAATGNNNTATNNEETPTEDTTPNTPETPDLDTSIATPTITIENADLNGDGIYNAEELGEDGTVSVTISVTGSQIGDTLTYTINGVETTIILTADDIADGITFNIEPNTTITAQLSDAAGNVSEEISATSLSVDLEAEAGTVTVNTIAGDDVINASESGAETIAVTGTATGGDIQAGDSVTVSVNGTDYTTTVQADGTYSVDVATSDLLADNSVEVDVVSTDSAGNSVISEGSRDISVDLEAEAGTVTVNTIAGDDVINASESGAETIAVTGTATGGDIQAGDSVTVSVNGTDYTTTVQADGTYSVDVATSDLLADNSVEVDVVSTDSAGNSVISEGSRDISVDTTVSVTSDLDDVSDTGVSNSDNITNDNTPTINGTTEAGATVVITTASGIVVGGAVADENGNYSITTTELPDGEQALTITATDLAGNTNSTTETITIDTTASDTTNLEITNIIDNNGDYSSVTMVGTGAESGNIITLYDEDGNAVASTTVQEDGTWSVDISNLNNTKVNDNEFFSVTETDLAGNETAQTDTTHFWHGNWSNTNTESTDDFIFTGAGDDTINTDAILSGTNENGTVTSDNNDTNDSLVIDAGDGNDTVTFGGNMSNYTLTTDANGNVIVTESSASDSNGDGIGDTIELRNVETIEFEDGTYDVGSGTFTSFDTTADAITASIEVSDVTNVIDEEEVVDTAANEADGIYERDGNYYQMQETSQVDTAALREMGYTIDSNGNFFKINEDAPKILVEQEMTREVTRVVDAEPIMKVATETTTFESLGQEFTQDVGVVQTWKPTTIELDEPTKNIELDFNNFNSGTLKIEFLNEDGNVIGSRTTFPAGDGERGYGIGEEFSSIRLTSYGSNVEVESVSGRGLPESVTVEAGGLVPDYEAMEEAGISWSSNDYQVITQTADINNIGNIGNSKVDGFNPEDHETSQVFDFGPDMANRLVTITVDLTVKGSWDNNVTSTNDYFSVSANGKEIDVNFYSNNSNSSTYESDDVSYIGWDNNESFTYEYQVYLDENGQVQLDFMVASTADDEVVDVKNIQVVYEGETGWTKEVTETETYTESVLVDAPAEQVDPSEIPGGIPYVSQEVEVEPNMTTETEVVGHTYSVDISAALSDIDGSETLSVIITGVPEGAVLSEGVDNGDGTWTVIIPEGDTSIADTLTMIVPSGTDDFELGIVATGTETNGGDTNTATDSAFVDVPDLVDVPTLDMTIGDVEVISGSLGDALEANGTNNFYNNSLIDGSSDSTVDFKDVRSAGIYMNGGDDTLTAESVNNANINMGSGDDTIYVEGNVSQTTIDTSGIWGSDNDKVIIDGKLSGGNINTGLGDDYVQLGDVGSSNINLGFGNDVLKLEGDPTDYYVVDYGFGNYRIVSGDFQVIDNGYSKWVQGGEWSTVTSAEAIVFGDGSYIGDASLAEQYLNASQSYQYTIDLNASLEDGSESQLGDITLNNIPQGAVLLDSNGNEIQANDDGSYTIQTDANHDASVTLVSDTELAQDSLNDINASVTATNGDDSLSVVVNSEGTVDTIEDYNQTDVDFDNLELDFDKIADMIEDDDGSLSQDDGDIDNIELSDMLQQDDTDESLSNLLGETEEDRMAANSSDSPLGDSQATDDGSSSTTNDYDPFKALQESGDNLRAEMDMNDSSFDDSNNHHQ
ncbi:hypothetical protein CRV08_08555 [Halarcobacter ebronensis]|uniref:Uncharacterized protein n=1 Tax=Halarcobacter ebronensis TaxID=1462615 RepID=A0A4Q0YD03_9BACT|nr:Ig-like domain-containing protein [Halarcobacter ebronensis]RXJ68292.1 hypothetical protein CRV08_08555 [Halarcobacter ebronensis]